ncbi:MAG: 2-amino-4-hydroxy-6-hydroxymethyldihydropteridine diphosphokinase [Bacteroidales bacterium]|nr:2-amino-4-hydroxy-6-hydroxymethyldihydropteridine diphosphokinase [Bacteroidales bacterium]
MENMELYKVVLLLGSNLPLGNLSPEQIIEEADKEIVDALLPDYLVVESLEEAVYTTDIISTQPCGEFEETRNEKGEAVPTPDFMNQVLCCITDKAPEEVLSQTQRIEKLFGRMRTYKEKNGIFQNRTLDIDILKAFKHGGADKTADKGEDKTTVWTEIEMNTPKLIIPHPQIKTRPFVSVLLNKLKI